MHFIHVDKIEHLIGNGYTNPMLASLSRGNEKFYAVIKTKDNKEGILTLVNELICYKMACALNILMPESGIAFIDEAIWDRYCFKQGFEGNDYLDKDILDSNEFLYSLFFRNKNITKQSLLSTAEKYPIVITKELLTDIIDNIPSDWDVPERDLEALKEYLLYRVGHINDICEMIAEYRNGGKDYV